MNTIVVPTDFSPAAENATTYAAQLARRIDASVLLLHVYSLPLPMTDYPILLTTADDVKSATDKSLAKALEKVKQSFPGVQFEAESRMGEVVTEIEAVCKEKNPFVFVVGAKEESGFDRFLFGDTTVSLARACSFPLISVTEGTTPNLPTNIVLATDMQNLEEIPVKKISAVVSKLQAALHVVHVQVKSEETISANDLLNALAGTNAAYHCITEKDVEEGLKHYVQENNIDLVLILPHKHNLYERLFLREHTSSILHSMPVPVMSLQ